MKILLVQMDKRRSEIIATELRSLSVDVDVLDDGLDAYHYLRSGMYDLAVLGERLNTMTRAELLRRLSQDDLSTVILFDDGQDVPAIQSEIQSWVLSKLDNPSTTLQYRGVTLSLSKRIVSCRNHRVSLSPTESEVLRILLEKPEQFVAKQFIAETIWNDTSPTIMTRLDVHLSSLRVKIKQLGCDTGIETKRNVGYRLTHKTT